MHPWVVLFMQKKTKRCSLSNASYQIHLNFDLRYNTIGQPTCRSWFPGFVARSRVCAGSELTDPEVWA